MDYEVDKVQKIEADTLDDCKAQLCNMYGRDWNYVGHKPKQVSYGLFKLGRKYVVELSYTVGHKNAYEEEIKASKKASEEAEFEQKKAAILLTTLSNTISQKLEETKKELSEQIAIKGGGTAEPESIKRIEENLYLNDFSKDYIKEISDKIRANFSLEQLENFDLVERKVVDWIGESIEIAKPKAVRPPHVVIIVGPTGVGKTTTLVKLAVQFVLSYKKNPQNEGRRPEICFIVTDFMRVGALEQLERYGDLINVQVLKAESSDDLKTLYEDNKDRMDAIFIDTSGYSPNDGDHIGSMKVLLDVPSMRPDVYLAVTASSKARDLENIFKNYEPFGYNSVIVTKCDESNQYGNVISVLHKKHKSISFIPNGQIVAKNIVAANPVDFLVRLENFNIDRNHIEDKFGGN